MSRLKAVVYVLAIGLGLPSAKAGPLAATPPSSAKPSASSAKPVSPSLYLRAGARCFNRGQLDLAARYFDAAHRQHQKLTEQEQVVLHVYLDELEKYAEARRKNADADVVPASATLSQPPDAAPSKPTRDPAPPTGRATSRPATPDEPESPPAGRPILEERPSRYETTDPKAKARWLLHSAREQIFLGHLDQAAKLVAEVSGMDVKWGYFDDTPAKVTKTLEAVRARAKSSRPPSARPLSVKSQPGSSTASATP